MNRPSPLPEPFRRARRATVITAGAATGLAAVIAVAFAQPEPARAVAAPDVAAPVAPSHTAAPAPQQDAAPSPAPRHRSHTAPVPSVPRPGSSSGRGVVTSGAS